MAVRKVLKMGDPRLIQRSQEIQVIDSDKVSLLIRDMLDTMKAMDGAGLAAPQIGVNKRIVVFGIDHNPRYPEAEMIDTTVLINPVIEILDKQIEEDWEGCLSVPGMQGHVPRFRKIRYRATDQNGDPINREAEGFHARVVQHEVDHLDGILYPMRITNLARFGYNDAFSDDLAE